MRFRSIREVWTRTRWWPFWFILVLIVPVSWLLAVLKTHDPIGSLVVPFGYSVLLLGTLLIVAAVIANVGADTKAIRAAHPDTLIFTAFVYPGASGRIRVSSPFQPPMASALTGIADSRGIRLVYGRDPATPSVDLPWSNVTRVELGMVQSSRWSVPGLQIVARDPSKSVDLRLGDELRPGHVAPERELASLVTQLESLRTSALQQES